MNLWRGDVDGITLDAGVGACVGSVAAVRWSTAAMAVASVFRHIQHFVCWSARGRCEIDPRPGSDEEGDRGEEKEQKERKAREMIQRRRGTKRGTRLIKTRHEFGRWDLRDKAK